LRTAAISCVTDLGELLLQEQGPLGQLAKSEPGDGGQAVVVGGDPETGAGPEQVTLGQVPQSGPQLVRGGDQQ